MQAAQRPCIKRCALAHNEFIHFSVFRVHFLKTGIFHIAGNTHMFIFTVYHIHEYITKYYETSMIIGKK